MSLWLLLLSLVTKSPAKVHQANLLPEEHFKVSTTNAFIEDKYQPFSAESLQNMDVDLQKKKKKKNQQKPHT